MDNPKLKFESSGSLRNGCKEEFLIFTPHQLVNKKICKTVYKYTFYYRNTSVHPNSGELRFIISDCYSEDDELWIDCDLEDLMEDNIKEHKYQRDERIIFFQSFNEDGKCLD